MKKQILCLSLCAATVLMAAEKTSELESQNVWATAISSSSDSLGDDEISLKQADHLSDLLRDIAGVDVGGTHNLNQKINIRGLEDLQLDIRLDGAPQNIYLFHHMGNLRINPDILKSADIQVGTNSIVFNGLGGGVRFETKDAEDLLQEGQNYGARVSATYSSNKGMGTSFTGYGKVNSWMDFLLYGSYNHTSNHKDGSGAEVPGGSGDIGNVLAKTTFKVKDNQRIKLSLDRYVDKGDYTARPNFGETFLSQYEAARNIPANTTYPTEYNRDTYTLKHELDLGDAFFLDSTVYYNKNYLSRNEDSTIRNAFVEGDGVNSGLTLLAQSYFESKALSHELTYGLEYQKQDMEQSTDYHTSGTATDISKESSKLQTAYIEDTIGYKNLFITPGVRFSKYERSLDEGSSQSWDEVTKALAAKWQVHPSFALKASVTELFQGPHLTEVFSTIIHKKTQNNALKAETGMNREIGFEYKTKNISKLDRLGLSFNIFKTTIEDYIEYDEYDSSTGKYQDENIGDVDIKGFELSFNAKKGNFDTTLSYAKSQSTKRSDGEPLSKDVGDSFNAKFNYLLPKQHLKLGWNATFVKANNRYTTDTYDKPGYAVHNVSAQYRPTGKFKNVVLTAAVENIFDKAYASHASEVGGNSTYNFTDLEPGRNFKATLSYSF